MNSQSLTDVLSETLEIKDELIEVRYQEKDRYTFMLGQLAFFLPNEMLSEVVENADYAYLPRMSENVLGLSNVRGDLVPVFDLHKFLNVDRDSKQQQHLLSIGVGDEAVGVLLDRLPFRVKESECQIIKSAPILPDAIKPFVSQVYKHGEQVILDYQHDALFSSLCQ